MINTEPNRDHAYSIRSCTACLYYAKCFTDCSPRMMWSDCAKYGCHDFISDNRDMMNEMPVTKPRKSRKALKAYD